MITTYRIAIDSCNACHGHDRVVEFKIEPSGKGGQLVRFCYSCRETLREALRVTLQADDIENLPGVPRAKYRKGEDGLTIDELSPFSDAELASLDQGFTRKRTRKTRKTRKKPTRKAGISPKARKKR